MHSSISWPISFSEREKEKKRLTASRFPNCKNRKRKKPGLFQKDVGCRVAGKGKKNSLLQGARTPKSPRDAEKREGNLLPGERENLTHDSAAVRKKEPLSFGYDRKNRGYRDPDPLSKKAMPFF